MVINLLSLQRDNKMLFNNRIYILIVTLCCSVFAVQAQTSTTTPVAPRGIAGFVCTKGTQVRVADVLVTNLHTNAKIITDDIGLFKIQASIGDTLLFTKNDYTSTKQVIYSPSDLVIFMQRVVHLDEVVVKEQTKQQELNSVMNQYKSKGVYNGGKTSALGAVAHPINALYDMFGSGPANARRFAEYSKKELEASQDHRKYNKELVKKITNLPDDEVQKFMDGFTPSHEDLLKWSDYEVIDYIKKSLEMYKKNGAVPLQKLY